MAQFISGIAGSDPIIESIVGRLLKPARVLDIIHDEDHESYQKFNTPSCFGFINHTLLSQENQKSNTWAKPLFPHFKSYPLKNEIVFIIEGPENDVLTGSNISTYYIPLTAIYNHPHQNFLPNKKYTTDDPSIGNNTFVYRNDIRPLKPFEGDVLVEGRFGNSIRLGSSNFNELRGFNPWSTNRESNSQPITIIRNGQKNEEEPGYKSIIEDINNDNSSIYLTTNQRITINPPISSFNDSYFSTRTNQSSQPKPSGLSNYTNSQVIIKSDRLVLNSKLDEIYLISKKSIGIHAIDGVNIDANISVINSPEIYLGQNASEPILKGNVTGEFLKDILDLISQLINDLILDFTLVSGAPGEKTGPFSGNFDTFQPIQKRISLLKTIVDNNSNGMKSTQNYTK